MHKAQGGESKAVLMCLAPSHQPLLSRRLFYTGRPPPCPVTEWMASSNGAYAALVNSTVVTRESYLLAHESEWGTTHSDNSFHVPT